VGEREPDGTDLVIAGSLGIDDAAGDIKVGLGVAVIEEAAVRIRKPNGGKAESNESKQCETQNAVQVLNSW